MYTYGNNALAVVQSDMVIKRRKILMVTAIKPKHGEKQFVTNNNGYLETYTLPEMYTLYLQEVSKQEYPDFECWLVDMLRSGIFQRL